MIAVGYCRVSTDEQGDSGLGLAAQEATISAEVARRGWKMRELHCDIASGKSLAKRPYLAKTLQLLADGAAGVLVVAKLDRLSRSVPDFASVLARSHAEGWALNVCDLGVDTTTPNGKMVAQIMMVLAEWEREMIGVRTKSALEAARQRGQTLGRPRGVSEDTLTLIRVLHESGKGYKAIANLLNGQGIASGQGGRWHGATVRKLYLRGDMMDLPFAHLAQHPGVPACMTWPIPEPGTTFEKWQAGRCAGCGSRKNGALVRDHDHATGLERGLLCPGCNTLEGANSGPIWRRWRSGWNPATLLGDERVYDGGYWADAREALERWAGPAATPEELREAILRLPSLMNPTTEELP